MLCQEERINMYLKKEKGRIWKLTGIFFACMILFTLLSRAVYQHGTAVVTTITPSSGTINHTVQITGKTIQNQELAVTTVAGLRIASVQVNEGQQVAQGDVLFTLDLEYLSETILTQKQEMEKQRLSIQDAWSQNAASQKQRSNQQAQAEENYNSAVSQAETALERAERDFNRAKTALENYYNGITSDEAEEEALILDCQEAKEAYETAQANLQLLQQEIEEKIQEAINLAEQERQQTAETVQSETMSSAETISQEETVVTEEILLPTETFTIVEALSQAEPLTQEEKDTIANAIRAEYAQRLSDAQAVAEQAQQSANDANAELEAFRQKQSSGTILSEQDLLDAVEKAQEGYDDALTALENAKTTYGRAVNSANLPAGTSHAAQIGQITYDQMTLELNKLEKLLGCEGKILAPVEGIVTRCYVQTGEKTTDTTAVLLADMSQGCRFSGLVTEEQSKYIGVGDMVTLRAGSTGKSYKDLPVTTFSTTEETGGGYRLTVQIPANTLTLGASVELNFTRKSQVYACCVPLSALHLDAKNQAYVLVVEQTDSVMGTELQARKVNVTVLEQNKTMAALSGGTLNFEDKVIIGSDRAIDSGSRVRVGQYE